MLAQQNPEYVQQSNTQHNKSFSDYVQDLKDDYIKNQSYYNNLFMNSAQTGLSLAALFTLGASAYAANKAERMLFNNGYSATVGGPQYTALMNKIEQLAKNSKAFDVASIGLDGIQGVTSLIDGNYGNAAINAGQIGATGISFMNINNPVSKWRYVPKLIGTLSNLVEVGNNIYDSLTTKKGESK